MSGTTDNTQSPQTLHDVVAARYAELSESSDTEEVIDDGLQGEGETQGETEREVEEEAASEGESINPPRSWSNSDKDFFRSLDKRAQEVILRREQEREQGLQQAHVKIAQERKALEAQRAQIAQLEAAAAAIKSNPLLGVTQILQAHGIDPRQYAQAIAQPPKQIDPQLVALQNQVQALGGYLQQQQNAQLQSSRQTLEQQVKTFAEAVDEKGNSLRPHFEDVAGEIEVLLPVITQSKPQANAHEILQEAYDRAVWANPSIRKNLISAEQQNAQRLADEKLKVERAKRAGSSVSGSPGTKGISAERLPDDLHASVAMIYKRLAARD